MKATLYAKCRHCERVVAVTNDGRFRLHRWWSWKYCPESHALVHPSRLRATREAAAKEEPSPPDMTPPTAAIPAIPLPLQWLPGAPDAEGYYWMDDDTYPVRVERDSLGDLHVRRHLSQPVPLAKMEARFAGPLPVRPKGGGV